MNVFPDGSIYSHLPFAFTLARPSRKRLANSNSGDIVTAPVRSMYPHLPSIWTLAFPSEKSRASTYAGSMNISPYRSIKPHLSDTFTLASPSEKSLASSNSARITSFPALSMYPHFPSFLGPVTSLMAMRVTPGYRSRWCETNGLNQPGRKLSGSLLFSIGTGRENVNPFF